MKLFITGGNGFIGSHFLDNVGDQFTEILAPVRRGPDSRRSNLAFKSYKGNTARLCDMLRDFRPEVVVNCAAAGINPHERRRDLLAEANVLLPARLYEQSRTVAVKSFLQLGSMAEYAMPAAQTTLSETDPVTYDNVYGVSKVAATSLLATLAETPGPAVTTLRLFGVFGRGEASHRLTSHLANKLALGETVPLSAGTQIRDFVYIRDVISAMKRAIAFGLDRDGGHEIFNIGSGEGISVRDFVYLFCQSGGFPVHKLDFGALPKRDTDASYLVANIKKAANLLDWRPEWIGKKGIEDYFFL